MIEPSIAVIVPNYNDIRHLPRCLRSVLDQHVGPQELIVIDDGFSGPTRMSLASTVRPVGVTS